jgi:hypothetical protein
MWTRSYIRAGFLSGCFGLFFATGASAFCPPCPPTPDNKPQYCVYPGSQNSHCEVNLLNEFRGLNSVMSIELEGKTFLIGPPDKLQVTPAK